MDVQRNEDQEMEKGDKKGFHNEGNNMARGKRAVACGHSLKMWKMWKMQPWNPAIRNEFVLFFKISFFVCLFLCMGYRCVCTCACVSEVSVVMLGIFFSHTPSHF